MAAISAGKSVRPARGTYSPPSLRQTCKRHLLEIEDRCSAAGGYVFHRTGGLAPGAARASRRNLSSRRVWPAPPQDQRIDAERGEREEEPLPRIGQMIVRQVAEGSGRASWVRPATGGLAATTRPPGAITRRYLASLHHPANCGSREKPRSTGTVRPSARAHEAPLRPALLPARAASGGRNGRRPRGCSRSACGGRGRFRARVPARDRRLGRRLKRPLGTREQRFFRPSAEAARNPARP